MADVVLTTVDNPFDPFTESDAWLNYDLSLSCSASSFLASFTSSLSDEFPEEFIDRELEKAMDEIIANDPLARFKKVTRKEEVVE